MLCHFVNRNWTKRCNILLFPMMFLFRLSIFLSFTILLLSFLKILFIYFLERRREGERKGEKHQCMVASHVALTRDLAGNPGMCPDWGLNQQPFASQSGARSTEPHQPEQDFSLLSNLIDVSYDLWHLGSWQLCWGNTVDTAKGIDVGQI